MRNESLKRRLLDSYLNGSNDSNAAEQILERVLSDIRTGVVLPAYAQPYQGKVESKDDLITHLDFILLWNPGYLEEIFAPEEQDSSEDHLEARFIEQEHRFGRILANLWPVIKGASQGTWPRDPRKLAAIKALLWWILGPANKTRVIVLSGVGVLGVLTLMVALEANRLFSEQNKRLDEQSQLLRTQTLVLQASPESRESRYDTLSRQISEEIANQQRRIEPGRATRENLQERDRSGPSSFSLSEFLLNEIIVFSRFLQPYAHLDSKPEAGLSQIVYLSPERGRLLALLANSGLPDEELAKLFRRADFGWADLRNMDFSNGRLMQADLRHARFPSEERFVGANMSHVNLEGARVPTRNFFEMLRRLSPPPQLEFNRWQTVSSDCEVSTSKVPRLASPTLPKATWMAILVANWRKVRGLLDPSQEGSVRPVNVTCFLVQKAGLGDTFTLARGVLFGDLETVETALKNRANPNARFAGIPLLIRAIEDGNIDIARALLRYGALPDVTDSEGNTPLLIAVKEHGIQQHNEYQILDRRDNSAIISELLERGAYSREHHEHEREMVNRCLSMADVQTLRTLFEAGIRVTPIAKDISSYSGSIDKIIETILFVLEQGGEVPEKVQQDAVRRGARDGDAVLVRRLLDAGVDVSGEAGIEAMEWAAQDARLETMKPLISAGVDLRGMETRTLARVAWNGNVEALQLLLEQGVATQGEDGREALLAAARNGHMAVLKMLLDQEGVAVDTADIVISAATGGHEDLVEFGIQRGIDLSGEVGQRALAAATAAGEENMVRFLHSRAAPLQGEIVTDGFMRALWKWRDVEEPDRYYRIISFLFAQGFELPQERTGQALVLAASEGSMRMVRLLAENGVPVEGEHGGRALGEAADGSSAERLQVVKFLVSRGASLETGGTRAIQCAAAMGDVDFLRDLLERVGEVRQIHGERALSAAARKGNKEIVALLLESGVSLARGAKIGSLTEAVGNGQEDVVTALLASGLNLTIHDGNALLVRAAQSGRVEILESLRELGVEWNAQGESRAFVDAAARGHVPVLESFLQNGLQIRMALGERAVLAAVDSRELESLQWLRGQGVSMAGPLGVGALELIVKSIEVDYRGGTPRKKIRKRDTLEIVKFLLESGADPKAKTSEGSTILQSAEEEGIFALVVLFEEHLERAAVE